VMSFSRVSCSTVWGDEDRSGTGGFSHRLHEIWHACLDQDILQVLTCPYVDIPQGRTVTLFFIGCLLFCWYRDVDRWFRCCGVGPNRKESPVNCCIQM
jgi:hypothetical protein